ncbi:ras-related protein Rab-39A-like [Carcharodon carcharias]|uniref:ras-related protein Rab-39A-like n=1 Tax=Carcharodon carcharias TaxID=13397 RepID=UPI001B7E658D|nr:ras-related protein Rab-39A-like [Carcharodon carcharias]
MGQRWSIQPGVSKRRVRRRSLRNFFWQFRVILVGASTVGKTSILLRLTEGMFREDVQKTIGVDYYIHILETTPTVRVKLQVWDTAGEKEHRTITQSHLQTILGGLLVFDLTNRQSLDYLRNWLDEAGPVLDQCECIFILVGHKSDLSTERQISQEEATQTASDLGMRYIETSARDGTNIQEVFLILATLIAESVKTEMTEVKGGIHGITKINGLVFLKQ